MTGFIWENEINSSGFPLTSLLFGGEKRLSLASAITNTYFQNKNKRWWGWSSAYEILTGHGVPT